MLQNSKPFTTFLNFFAQKYIDGCIFLEIFLSMLCNKQKDDFLVPHSINLLFSNA